VVAGVKGSLAAGIDLVYETLLVSSLDEISSGYGLLAEVVSGASKNGTPVTPDGGHAA
jgi:microcin C transport system substrate-binding protein